MLQNKLLEPGVQTMVNRSNIKFEPYGDLVHEAYSHYNPNILDNQDPCSQNENDETGETVCSKDEDDQNAEPNRNSAILNFVLKIIADDEILESIHPLNSK